MEREVGGGIGMGNTCKSMAVSFQCMTKSTTIKKKNNKKKKKKKRKGHLPGKLKRKKKMQIAEIFKYLLIKEAFTYLKKNWLR